MVQPRTSVAQRVKIDEARNRIVKVTGREIAPNDGILCVKGRYGFEFPSSPRRLTRPLIKKNGKHLATSFGSGAMTNSIRELEDAPVI